jgi:hypothetical protein
VRREVRNKMGVHKYANAVKVRVVKNLGNLKGYDPIGLTRLPQGEAWNVVVYKIGEKGNGPVARLENKPTEEIIRLVGQGYRGTDFEVYAEQIQLTDSERKLRGMRPVIRAVRPAKDFSHLDALATGEIGEGLE